MIGRDEVTLGDLLRADDLQDFMRMWDRYEADPVWLLGALVVAVLFWAKFMTVSPLDKREPQRGTHYLGNVRLGQNPKADGPGPLRTRLKDDPQFHEDDPLK
ncbi:MAG: hypothetical protein AAF281_16915 [Pseudomonadota bacterium]